MKCAIISPIPMLNFSMLVDTYHMVLPEGLDLAENIAVLDPGTLEYKPGQGTRSGVLYNPMSQAYAHTYRNLKGYKILDNGAAEGKQYAPTDLARFASYVNADEVVIPDVMGDAQGTIDAFFDFREHMNPDMKYMGVVQGATMAEVLKCLYLFLDSERVDTIALPRILQTIHKHQRVYLAELMHDKMTDGEWPKKDIHCLGATSWAKEVIALAEYQSVRGIDTSLPVVYGLAGKSLEADHVSRSDLPMDFMTASYAPTSLTWKQIYDNVITYLGWTGNRPLQEAPGGELR